MGPGAELQRTCLLVKGEPGDVDLAGRLKESGGNVEATSITADNHICLVRSIKFLIRAEIKTAHNHICLVSLDCPQKGAKKQPAEHPNGHLPENRMYPDLPQLSPRWVRSVWGETGRVYGRSVEKTYFRA